MTRNNAREIAMQMVFALSFQGASAEEMLERDLTSERFERLKEECDLYGSFPNKKQADYIRELVRGTDLHAPELDGYISKYARNWSFSRIPRMAAAIMRTAMYELLYMPDVPNAAAINSAIEIAKNYESPQVVSFMNGILGSFSREEFKDTPPKPEKNREPVVTDQDFDAEVPAE